VIVARGGWGRKSSGGEGGDVAGRKNALTASDDDVLSLLN